MYLLYVPLGVSLVWLHDWWTQGLFYIFISFKLDRPCSPLLRVCYRRPKKNPDVTPSAYSPTEVPVYRHFPAGTRRSPRAMWTKLDLCHSTMESFLPARDGPWEISQLNFRETQNPMPTLEDSQIGTNWIHGSASFSGEAILDIICRIFFNPEGMLVYSKRAANYKTKRNRQTAARGGDPCFMFS